MARRLHKKWTEKVMFNFERYYSQKNSLQITSNTRKTDSFHSINPQDIVQIFHKASEATISNQHGIQLNVANNLPATTHIIHEDLPPTSLLITLFKSTTPLCYAESQELCLPSNSTLVPCITPLESCFGIKPPKPLQKYIQLENEAYMISRFSLIPRIFLASIYPIIQHFLPSNFAEHMEPELGKRYIHFAGHSFISNVFGSAASIVSMQALLIAMGLTAVHAAPAAAALNWILKDLIGQIGGSLLASHLASSYDAQTRLHRLRSARLLIWASTIELLTPLFPGLFVLIGAFANTAKNVAYLTMSSTRAAIHMSFVRRANLADMTAKSGVQATVAGVIGTAIGAWLSYWLATNSSDDTSSRDTSSDANTPSEPHSDDSNQVDTTNSTNSTNSSSSTTLLGSLFNLTPGISVQEMYPNWIAFGALSFVSYWFLKHSLRVFVSHRLDTQRFDILLSRASSKGIENGYINNASHLHPTNPDMASLIRPKEVFYQENWISGYIPKGWNTVGMSVNRYDLSCGDLDMVKSDIVHTLTASGMISPNNPITKHVFDDSEDMVTIGSNFTSSQDKTTINKATRMLYEMVGTDAENAAWTLNNNAELGYYLTIRRYTGTNLHDSSATVINKVNADMHITLDSSVLVNSTLTSPVEHTDESWIQQRMRSRLTPHRCVTPTQWASSDQWTQANFTRRSAVSDETAFHLPLDTGIHHGPIRPSPLSLSQRIVSRLCGSNKLEVRVWLRQGACQSDVVLAYTQAYIARQLCLLREIGSIQVLETRNPLSDSVKNDLGSLDNSHTLFYWLKTTLSRPQNVHASSDLLDENMKPLLKEWVTTTDMSDRDIVKLSKRIVYDSGYGDYVLFTLKSNDWDIDTLHFIDNQGCVDVDLLIKNINCPVKQ